MKAYGGVDVQIHIFLTLALTGGEWSASHPEHDSVIVMCSYDLQVVHNSIHESKPRLQSHIRRDSTKLIWS
jgi:hypothetical protein